MYWVDKRTNGCVAVDIKSQEARSYNMSRIKGRNTGPEMYIRSLLHRRGFRYYVNYALIEGKPDLFFSRYKAAVFVHGCYWHRHKNCRYAYTPKTNTAFWVNKLEGNRCHDEEVVSSLMGQGIRVLIIWECTVKKMQKDRDLENRIFDIIQVFIKDASSQFLEI